MFDMSGSGKSEGSYVTYGLKEQEDIGNCIDYLRTRHQMPPEKVSVEELCPLGQKYGSSCHFAVRSGQVLS